jgi:hypothetical protein
LNHKGTRPEILTADDADQETQNMEPQRTQRNTKGRLPELPKIAEIEKQNYRGFTRMNADQKNYEWRTEKHAGNE